MFVLRVMEIVDTAMLFLMTIRYLNSPVTGQGDFLFPVSSDALPAFLKLPQNDLIPIYMSLLFLSLLTELKDLVCN